MRIAPFATGIRDVDRTVADVAAANAGRYDIDVHLRHDPSAPDAFAETHVRRLEAMRRLTGSVTREVDGTWIIAPDHLDRAAVYEAARAKDRPVAVETLFCHLCAAICPGREEGLPRNDPCRVMVRQQRTRSWPPLFSPSTFPSGARL